MSRNHGRNGTANDLRTHVYQLADDSMRGRRAGERGNVRATAYVADVFRRLGLRPAGDSGSFFQTLPYGGSSPGVYQKLLDLGLMSFATDHPDVTWDAVKAYYKDSAK